MRRIGIVCSIAMLLLASQADGAYVFFDNFENGLGSGGATEAWQSWQQAGTVTVSVETENQPTANAPLYPLGDIAGQSGSNLQSAHINGAPTTHFNGGMWRQIPVPIGVALTIDGFWRCHAFKRNDQWTEIIVWDGQKTIANGTDYNPPGEGKQNGSLLDGEVIYKIYTNNAPDNTYAYAGQFSNTTLKSPVAYAYKVGPNIPASTTGWLTVLVKFGHTSTSAKSFDVDDIYITPEPAAMVLLLLAMPLLLRRRRA